ncbi:oxidative stress defense protein [Shewanella sp.]|uniref:oxidative stress defense protein n=1 Tax=Shewanella sp. TaxID=50422 RepID=UPI0040540659
MSTSISASTAFIAALSLSSALLGAAPAAADNLSFAHIQTIGVSELTMAPDMAEIQVEVSLTKDSAKAAKDASDKAVSEFIERLLKAGIDKKHIASANLHLQPEYLYEQNKAPKLIGYQASRQVTVTLEQLSRLNDILDTALAEGLNRVNNIALKSSKEDEYLLKARQAAIKDAQAKASSLAEGFNQSLGDLWQVRYLDRRSVQPIMLQRSEKMAFDSGQAGYEFGEVTVSDSVEVIYKLKN